MPNIETIFLIIFAYLLGSFSSAVVVSKLLHLPDPRTQGSHNPGATNVMRIGGKKAGALTLAGDVLKGLIPVLLAKAFGLDSLGVSLTGFAAFIGHLYPVFFSFRGGKGVATALGVLIGLSAWAGVGFIVVWGLVLFISRYVSVASMVATLVSPLFLWFFTGETTYCLLFVLIALLVVFRHRENIRNIRLGTEGKTGTSSKLA